jgi:dTDP-4-dehydrorhamnose 3,5-epimerase-like enzyme
MRLKEKQLTFQKLNPNKISLDERGSLFAVNSLSEFKLKRLYLIEPTVGHWRGKHYHKESTQLIVVLNGEIECKIFDLDNQQNVNNFFMSTGCSFEQNPGITFSFRSKEQNTKILVLSNTELNESDYYEVKIS